jgi:hypothetical protein
VTAFNPSGTSRMSRMTIRSKTSHPLFNPCQWGEGERSEVVDGLHASRRVMTPASNPRAPRRVRAA